MASLVFIEDTNGDTIEANIYCSNACASTDKLYAGFNGCHELEYNEVCRNCNEIILGTQGEVI